MPLLSSFFAILGKMLKGGGPSETQMGELNVWSIKNENYLYLKAEMLLEGGGGVAAPPTEEFNSISFC